ncbi:MAG: hypothetical protein K9N34_06240, partial [Candidatus Marinimicrobia bacterium]|nr:hypothetical protein [Candidatus Neomarinimicrobiota bacterium]
MLVLTMCTDQGNPVVEPTPEFLLSTDSVNFGAVQIGDSRLQFVEIRNPGSADLTGDLMLQ